jgi:hypothetical protein
MDYQRAHKTLYDVLDTINEWGQLYERRWGYGQPHALENPALDRQVNEDIDEVRFRFRSASQNNPDMERPNGVSISNFAEYVVIFDPSQGNFRGFGAFPMSNTTIVQVWTIPTLLSMLSWRVRFVGSHVRYLVIHAVAWTFATTSPLSSTAPKSGEIAVARY